MGILKITNYFQLNSFFCYQKHEFTYCKEGKGTIMENQLKNKHVIVLNSNLSETEYDDIHNLEVICKAHDKTNLKLELDFKKSVSSVNTEAITEFLYYIDNKLIAYLGICCFGGKANELNGMVHPDYRRKGYFSKLFYLALSECRKDLKREILLLSDGKCESGIRFIESMQGKYSFSEYRMRQLNPEPENPNAYLILRNAKKNDLIEIAHQNAIYFNTIDDYDQSNDNDQVHVDNNLDNTDSNEQCKSNEQSKTDAETYSFHETTFIIELDSNTIGKICIEFNENTAFIFGFGIKPEYRGLGYGRAALIETLKLIHNRNITIIELDVECKNDTALNLYKSCGFVEQSVMNYYEHSGKI